METKKDKIMYHRSDQFQTNSVFVSTSVGRPIGEGTPCVVTIGANHQFLVRVDLRRDSVLDGHLGYELHFHHQREMVRGNAHVRTARNLVGRQPVQINGAEHAEDGESLSSTENVINDTTELMAAN